MIPSLIVLFVLIIVWGILLFCSSYIINNKFLFLRFICRVLGCVIISWVMGVIGMIVMAMSERKCDIGAYKGKKININCNEKD